MRRQYHVPTTTTTRTPPPPTTAIPGLITITAPSKNKRPGQGMSPHRSNRRVQLLRLAHRLHTHHPIDFHNHTRQSPLRTRQHNITPITPDNILTQTQTTNQSSPLATDHPHLNHPTRLRPANHGPANAHDRPANAHDSPITQHTLIQPSPRIQQRLTAPHIRSAPAPQTNNNTRSIPGGAGTGSAGTGGAGTILGRVGGGARCPVGRA